jgi:hypothetical protein
MIDDHRWLRFCALFYALGLALHTVDHVRRGLDAITPQVLWAGNVSTVIGITVVVLVVTGSRYGPLLAAVTGIPIALGVALVHLVPEWSALSDSFVGAHNTGVTALSWTVVLIEIAGALALGVVGLHDVSRERDRTDAAPQASRVRVGSR